MGRFINPFTDYGFKFLFGREVEKELLISFLNDLLVGEHVITDIQFLNNEQQPEVKNERGNNLILRTVLFSISQGPLRNKPKGDNGISGWMLYMECSS